MKKIFFALACVIGLMTFASCDQEVIDDIMAQKPTIEFMAEEGFIASNTSVYVGTELNFKVKVAPNSGSESELAHLDFSITDLTGATVFNQNPEFTNPNGENVFVWSFTPETPSTYVVTATLTDKANKVNIVKVVVDCVQEITEGIGTFTGKLDILGHITSNTISNIPPYDEDYNLENLDMKVVLGNNVNGKVNVSMEIDGTPVTLYATMEGNNLVFDPFHFYKEIELTPQNVILDLVMNMTGVLDGDNLTLGGNCAGSGSTQIIVVTFTVNMTGTIQGNLVKQAEQE